MRPLRRKGIPRRRLLLGAVAALAGAVLLVRSQAVPPGPFRGEVPEAVLAHWSGPWVSLLLEMGVLPEPPHDPDAPVDAGRWTVWLCRAVAWPKRAAGCRAPAVTGRALTRLDAVEQAVARAPTVYREPDLPPGAAGHPGAALLAEAVARGLLAPDLSIRPASPARPGAEAGPDAGSGAGFDPDRPLTAAEAATLLGRLVVNRHEGTAWQLEPGRQRPLDRLRLLLHPDLAGPHRYVRVERAGGEVVAARVRVAETSIAKMVGAEAGLGEGLLLVGASAIHTAWGPVPLDVVFLDGDGVIVALYPELPRGVSRGAAGAADALELPGGRIRALGLGAGERLRVVTEP